MKTILLAMSALCCTCTAANEATGTRLPDEVQQLIISGLTEVGWQLPDYQSDIIDGSSSISDIVAGTYTPAFPFKTYPRGGYLVRCHADLFGDTKPETVYIVVRPIPDKGEIYEHQACVYDSEQNFCYTIPMQCLTTTKRGQISVGEKRTCQTFRLGGDKGRVYSWHQWLLSPHYAQYDCWLLREELTQTDETIGSEAYTERIIVTRTGRSKESQRWENGTQKHRHLSNILRKHSEHEIQTESSHACHITSIYEVLMKKEPLWITWSGDMTEGLHHWNSVRQEIIRESSSATAPQVIKSDRMKQQIPQYPIFSD